MTVYLTHAIILTHEEAEDIRKEGGSFEFGDVSFCDYIVHAFYDEYHDEIIYLEDNIDGNPRATFEGIELGIRAGCGLLEITEKVIILPEGADPYKTSHVLKAMRDAVN